MTHPPIVVKDVRAFKRRSYIRNPDGITIYLKAVISSGELNDPKADVFILFEIPHHVYKFIIWDGKEAMYANKLLHLKDPMYTFPWCHSVEEDIAESCLDLIESCDEL